MRRFPKLAADPGRIVANPDNPVGTLHLALFEIPAESHNSHAPRLFLAASTSTPGWKRQCIELSHAGRTQIVQTAPRKSVLGQTLTQLGESGGASTVEVALRDADQWLMSCSDDDLQVGENLALIGIELVQFGHSKSLGHGRFRISRMLRGRAGTEATIHCKGEPFVLLQRGSLQPIDLAVWVRGRPVRAATQQGSAQCSLTPAFRGLAPSGWRLSL